MDKLVIGLTGTTGSGKSTVAKVFEKNGCKVIDADIVAREIMIPPSECLDKLCYYFGKDIINNDGTLKRKLLAERAFSSKKNTELLNSVTHPFIVKKISEYICQTFENNCNMVVIDAPQLFESKADIMCNIIIGVIAPIDMRIERIINRDNITKEQAMQRISIQHTDKFFEENCHYIINNNSTEYDLINNTVKIISELKVV